MAPFREMSRQLAPRSIRVIIAPTPSTFAERRSVLQVLQTFGKIDIFRRVIGQRAHKYICVTNTEQTAKLLVHSSPIGCRVSIPKMDYDKRVRALVNNAGFTLPKVDVNPQGTKGKVMVNVGDDNTQAGDDLRIKVGSGSINSQLLADAAAVEAAVAAAMEEQPQPKEAKQQQQQKMDKSEQGDFEIREFELTIVPANDYDHSTIATSTIESRRWPSSYITDKSFVAATLSDMLPDNLMKEGLVYWHLNPIFGGCKESVNDRIAQRGQVPGMIALEAAKLKEAKKKEPTGQTEQMKQMKQKGQKGQMKQMKQMGKKHKAMRGKD